MNDLNENTLNPNCFEKTKEAWAIFSFFSSTNVETKNVCPIAYNYCIWMTPSSKYTTNKYESGTNQLKR